MNEEKEKSNCPKNMGYPICIWQFTSIKKITIINFSPRNFESYWMGI